jgi:starch phosphorylase
VELLHGPVVGGDELSTTEMVRLELAGPASTTGAYGYEGSFVCDTAGRHGYTVRIVPSHPDLALPAEMGCIAWA